MEQYPCWRIYKYLKGLGFKPSLKGFNYIETAMQICKEHPEYLQSVNHDLYDEVAKQHSSTKANVERTIRYSIKCARLKGNAEFTNTFRDFNSGALTNSLVLNVLFEALNKF